MKIFIVHHSADFDGFFSGLITDNGYGVERSGRGSSQTE